jgi:hypothetical protein
VDAYLKLNQPENAMDVTRKITDFSQDNTASFCKLWSTEIGNPLTSKDAQDALSFLKCKN